MLNVYNINIKVYAESQAEADALQTEFLAFVRDKREHGVAVKASRIIEATLSAMGFSFISVPPYTKCMRLQRRTLLFLCI